MIVSERSRYRAQKLADDLGRDLTKAVKLRLNFREGPSTSVTWRVKSAISIEAKSRIRGQEKALNDFIGLRVVVPHVGLLDEALEIVRDWSTDVGISEKNYSNLYAKIDEDKYRAIHIDYDCGQYGRIIQNNAGIEVQITTYLQLFYSSISHELIYWHGNKENRDKTISNSMEIISVLLSEVDSRVFALFDRLKI